MVQDDDDAAAREAVRRRVLIRSVIAWFVPMLVLALAFLFFMLR
ncbi:hypothetical protein [Pseudactinotalea sp. Z1748]